MKRIPFLDSLRGFAIVGVFFVNAFTINGPFWMDTYNVAFQASPLDTWLASFFRAFFVEKFYLIFVFLFGITAALMLKSNPLLFIKRRLVLVLLGLAHVYFLFWGDVLIVYALIGLLFFFIRNWSPKSVFSAGIFFFLVTTGCYILLKIRGLPADDYSDLMITPYGTGTFLEIANQRLSDYYEWFYWGLFQKENFSYFLDYIVYFLEVLTIMIFGFWAGSQKEALIRFIREKNLSKPLVISAGVSAAVVSLGWLFPDLQAPLIPTKKVALLFLFVMGYLAFARRCSQPRLETIGRLTLTWYLGFSLFMSLLLHGNFLGLYGTIGPTQTTLIAVVFLLFTLWISPLLLKRFKRGPFEALVRRIAG